MKITPRGNSAPRVVDYSVYKDHGPGEWDSGVLTVSLTSWTEFYSVTSTLLDRADFIWRGQQNDWPLKSKFDRITHTHREEALRMHTQVFMRAMRCKRGSNPPQLNTDDEIWSLGQHHGLPTPLLDWTESPFVAAYFAFECNADERAEHDACPQRYVYALSEDVVRWGPARSSGERPYGQFIQVVEPQSDENSRLISQRALFTKPLSGDIEVEATVRRCYGTANEKAKGRDRIILVRIQIPETERDRCLRDLNRMNINHATLFPDLTGAARYCAMKLEIEGY